MKSDNFILCLSAYVSEAGFENPITEAARFVIDFPDVIADTSPEDAAQECIALLQRAKLESLYDVADQITPIDLARKDP